MPGQGASVRARRRLPTILLGLALSAPVVATAGTTAQTPSSLATPGAASVTSSPAPVDGPSSSPVPSCPPDASPSPTPSASPALAASPGPSSAPTADPCTTLLPDPSATPTPTARPYLTPIPIVAALPSASPEASAVPTPSPTPKPVKPGGIRAKLDVPISRRLPCYEFPRDGCINRVDIHYPRNAGSWPTVVTIHGRPRTPDDMHELARALAKGGAVVFNADYRGVRPVSKGFPESINDVACAIRYARANTAKYGGDPNHIVLVGHSYGGYVGTMVSVAGNRFAGKGIGCLEDRGSSLPDGFVHIAGVSITKASEPLDAIYFGGSQAAIPETWERGNVFHQIELGGNRRLKVGIIFELNDPYLGYAHATWLRDALKEEGYDVRMQLLEEGRTHFDVLDMDTELGRTVLRFVERVIHRSAPVESDDRP